MTNEWEIRIDKCHAQILQNILEQRHAQAERIRTQDLQDAVEKAIFRIMEEKSANLTRWDISFPIEDIWKNIHIEVLVKYSQQDKAEALKKVWKAMDVDYRVTCSFSKDGAGKSMVNIKIDPDKRGPTFY